VLLRTDLPHEAVTVSVDADLIKQALLNLMLNAMQAMEATTASAHKELILRVERSPANPRQPAEAVIHIIDTGPGIDPSRHEEIFRPYVTARRGGKLTLFSEVGKGSDFQIRIPMTGSTPGTDAPVAPAAA
jgi:signal transduction histidine kinase